MRHFYDASPLPVQQWIFQDFQLPEQPLIKINLDKVHHNNYLQLQHPMY